MMGRVVGVLALALALGASVAQAETDTRSCGFTIVGGDSQVNALFPDAAATYWVANEPVPPGGYIEVHGQFPHARYTSLTTTSTQLQSVDGLADKAILPDLGSTNPFLPKADRIATERSYTVRIVKGQVPAAGRAPNTIYTTSADGSKSGGLVSQRFSLRIYEGDAGTGRKGGVPLPEITLVSADGTRTAIPACPDVMAPDTGATSTLAASGTGEPAPADTSRRAEDPPVWHKFTSTGAALTGGLAADDSEGGFGDNPDNKYVYTNYSQGFGQVLVFRAKAPTYPPTYDGEPKMGTGQLRYWSICTNTSTTQVYACRQDDQIPVDAAGYYSLAISTGAARPKNATEACGVTWLPAGPFQDGVLILRNMLPDPGFAEAINNTQPGTEAQVMGDYYPRGRYYATTADYERTGCNA